MVKKHQNPLKIDFKRCIVEDVLLQIRDSKHIDTPDLAKVWTVEIVPRDSPHLMKFLKEGLPDEDPVSYLHCKRLRKTEDGGRLCVIICSVELIEEQGEVARLLAEAGISYSNLALHNLPRAGPSTRELSLEWGRKFWPLVWRGNPNDQILNDYTFDMARIRSILRQISDTASEKRDQSGNLPVVSAFVNPLAPEQPIIAVDQRGGNPLHHSIMNGIKEVARDELQRREAVERGTSVGRTDTYLCLDFDVYTTHEPCSMCAMALIHSRIKRCIFIQPMPETGALRPESGDGYCMHSSKALNSKYEVFQWVGDGYVVPDISGGTCC
ncbi:AFR493Cp [Eremothecium gossypii ATCC 10895]|uniref:AFR493Cp n=1 Tax=Eremothecium gossypii (strain ATCC 10895 / CBS 109.51 / FGSC 9923 / NRRL Y-1056) TaxID=284811 RepID=Q752T0_EREGS|nr:AFR493Cp [Eremothecium gossypii ATCC 10895]AAS53864.1 AFR493Cp [Eremothecium gossypii ATCC 10895]AEY98177.1 FAFR493Cp [Eremothecium gossypii FDAG1]